MTSNGLPNDIAAKVTVILVTYNSAHVVGDALRSLPAGLPVILVDNASIDHTCEVAAAVLPHTRIIRNQTNLGFARANNIALEHTDTPYALLLNPDARLQDDTLPTLIAAADAYQDGAIFAPLVIEDKGRPRPAFRFLMPARIKVRDTFDYTTLSGHTCTEFVSGAVMLLRMAAFADRPHIFDPKIFLYFDDEDICIDARRRGFSVILVPESTASHLAGMSTTPSKKVAYTKERYRIASYLYFTEKYKGRRSSYFKTMKMLFRFVGSSLGYLITLQKDKFMQSASRVAGIFTYILG